MIAAILKAAIAMFLLYLILFKVFLPWFSTHMTEGVSSITHSKVTQQK